MIIRWPEKIAANTRIDRMVGTVDFMPTILTLMGFEPCGREQGRDASGILRGEDVAWDDVCYAHHAETRAGVFTLDYELAYVKDHDSILFDRKNDPDQVNNLFHSEEHQEAIAAMTADLAVHHAAVDSPAAEWLQSLV
jgi:arylsulfatase A-like enzyme